MKAVVNRRPAICAFAIALALAGCSAADHYRRAAADTPPARLFNVPFPAAFPPTTLNTVITYGSGGSWKLQALWDEYMVTIRNNSERPLFVTSATLVDFAGREHAPGTDPWMIEETSKALCREYDRTGVAFAKEGATAALYVGGIASGAGLFASIASTGGVTVTALQGPIAVVTVPCYIAGRSIENHDARADIQAEFNQRRLVLPLKVAPGQVRLGCFFFPMVPSPQRLRLHWKTADAEGDAELALEFLRGLHTPRAGLATH